MLAKPHTLTVKSWTDLVFDWLAIVWSVLKLKVKNTKGLGLEELQLELKMKVLEKQTLLKKMRVDDVVVQVRSETQPLKVHF